MFRWSIIDGDRMRRESKECTSRRVGLLQQVALGCLIDLVSLGMKGLPVHMIEANSIHLNTHDTRHKHLPAHTIITITTESR
jgi:hypothetical protein